MINFDFWPVIFLAVAISIDGLSVGITYGLRKIKLGLLPLLIIGAISTLSIYLSSQIGSLIGALVNKGLAEELGGAILVGLGLWLLVSAKLKSQSTDTDEKLLASFKIKPLGIIINILKEPIRADLDRSGSISNQEAFFLGLALALDALGVGLGAGMVNFASFYFSLFIGLVNILFVSTGFLLGAKLGDVLPPNYEIIPSLLLIFIGLLEFI